MLRNRKKGEFVARENNVGNPSGADEELVTLEISLCLLVGRSFNVEEVEKSVPPPSQFPNAQQWKASGAKRSAASGGGHH